MLVDAHVHFFDYDAAPELSWSWLESDEGWSSGGSRAGSMAAVRSRRFTPAELWAEAGRLTGLTKCVHVESAHGSDSVRETAYLARLREQHGAPHAAIVRVELDRPDLDRRLDEHCGYGFVRGVREPGKAGVLDTDAYADGVRRLGERDLIFEVYCSAKRFAALGELARRCPDTPIVLEHFGVPPRPGTERFAAWSEGLHRLAERPNVLLKVSGLGLMATDWTFSEAAALTAESLSAFGVQRCLFGSNFPVDRAMSSYPDGYTAIQRATGNLTEEERHALFVSNAESLYRI
ncbi:MAG TPA: amidohydrolase family protein [Pseudonocardia sp.]|nr:amidohydrolase family protein [Pseudonocardia sp.]